MQIGNFNAGKGLNKTLLGMTAVALTFAAQNPSMITNLIPEHWKTITLAGLIVEGIDYLLNLIKKKQA